MTEATQYQSIAELVAAGIVRIAEKPPHNWRDLDAVPSYTVPLLAEDYPAKTAVMWNAVYERLGMSDRNTMMIAAPKNAAVILSAFRRDPKYRGGGCGIGFKEVVVPLLNDVTPNAKAIGAVNIIKRTAKDRLVGANTDGLGYAIALEDLFVQRRDESLGGKKVLILGAGGSASAIAFALAERGAELTILNRTEERAHELAERLNRYRERTAAVAGGRNRIADALPRQDAVISAIDDPNSPLDRYSTLGTMALPVTDEAVGRNLEESRALLTAATPSLVVSDIRIRAEETAMLHQARELGLVILNGIPMVVNQGIEAFWWLYGDELSARGLRKEDVAAIMREAAAVTT
mgnify:CR=1 FL=1